MDGKGRAEIVVVAVKKPNDRKPVLRSTKTGDRKAATRASESSSTTRKKPEDKLLRPPLLKNPECSVHLTAERSSVRLELLWAEIVFNDHRGRIARHTHFTIRLLWLAHAKYDLRFIDLQFL